MSTIIRIGTIDNQIGLWQANALQHMLEKLGHKTQAISIKPSQNATNFTQDLDTAILNNNIDIAVHTLKDVPTVLQKGIVQAAVIKRGNFKDLLVFKNNEEFLSQKNAIIATSNIRCKAQWLNRYPTHTIENLQGNGNLNSQLQELDDNTNWNAGIYDAASLGRLGLKPEDSINLDWMIPDPAQGAIMITARENDEDIKTICAELNHTETEICTTIEREFLNLLETDFDIPIGALAFVKEEEVHFKGVVLNADGSKKIEVTRVEPLSNYQAIASHCAEFIIDRGGKNLIDNIKRSSLQTNIYSTKTLTTEQRSLFSEKVIFKSSDFVKISLNRIKPQIIRNPIENVIITSKNSVDALLHNFSAIELQFKNIYCVGRRTKRIVEKQIGKVKHTEKTEKALADYLVEFIEGTEITCFSGDLNLSNLSTIIEEHNITVNSVEAYQTKNDAVKIDENIEGVMFYNPSTIQSYLKVNDAVKIAFCTSEATANEAKKHFEDVRIAKLPTIESIIDLVNEYFN